MPASKVELSDATRTLDMFDLISYSQHWPHLFPQHGPGVKHNRRIALEPWQQRIVDRYPGRLLRGLIHSDGCRVTNRIRHPKKTYAYPRYFFSNKSLDIQRIFCEACDQLEVAWRQDGPWNISVARREAVAILDRHVGPKALSRTRLARGMRVHHINCGTSCPRGARLLNGEGGFFEPARMVCHCLLIEADDGLVLVDTGYGIEDARNPRQLGPSAKLTGARPSIEEAALTQVEGLGFAAGDVRHIVITHLDPDHSGGLPDFPDAEVHVFEPELRAAMNPGFRERPRYLAPHWRHGPNWVEHAVDGDEWKGFESVRVLPAPRRRRPARPAAGPHRRPDRGRDRRRGRLAPALRRRLLPPRPARREPLLPAGAEAVPDDDRGRQRAPPRQRRTTARARRGRGRQRAADLLPRPARARSRTGARSSAARP